MTSGSDSSKITEMERVYKAQFCIQCEKRMVSFLYDSYYLIYLFIFLERCSISLWPL